MHVKQLAQLARSCPFALANDTALLLIIPADAKWQLGIRRERPVGAIGRHLQGRGRLAAAGARPPAIDFSGKWWFSIGKMMSFSRF